MLFKKRKQTSAQSLKLGELGEQLARQHLKRLGLTVIERNFRSRYGEIDLIAIDGNVLVFCEVKSRRAGSGKPFDSLHNRKQQQVRRMAAEWLSKKKGNDFKPNLRFDAIGITIDSYGKLVSLEHLEDAF